MLLFKVEATYPITGKGLILAPGVGDKHVSIGQKIRLIRPDKSEIETIVRGVTFEGNHDILVDEKIKKEDVPIGTEVWLDELM